MPAGEVSSALRKHAGAGPRRAIGKRHRPVAIAGAEIDGQRIWRDFDNDRTIAFGDDILARRERDGRAADRKYLQELAARRGGILRRGDRDAIGIQLVAYVNLIAGNDIGAGPSPAAGERHRAVAAAGAEVHNFVDRRHLQEVQIGPCRRRQPKLGRGAIRERLARDESDLVGDRIDQCADVAVGRSDDDVLRRDIRCFDIDLRAGGLLEQAGGDAGKQFIRRPHLDLAGERRDLIGSKQIGEIRIENVRIVVVERDGGVAHAGNDMPDGDRDVALDIHRLAQGDGRAIDRGDGVVRQRGVDVKRCAVAVRIGCRIDIDAVADRVAESRPCAARQRDRSVDGVVGGDVGEAHLQRRGRHQRALSRILGVDRDRAEIHRRVRFGGQRLAGFQGDRAAVDRGDGVVGFCSAGVERSAVGIGIRR